MFGYALDLQGQEGLVDVVDIGMAHGLAKLLLPTCANYGVLPQCFDVLPLAQPHRAACFGQGELEVVGLFEGIYKNLRGGEGAKIDDGACPVKNDGFNSGVAGVGLGKSGVFGCSWLLGG